MSETTDLGKPQESKVETAQMSSRVKTEDKIWYKEFIKTFPVEHEAFSAIVKKFIEPTTVETNTVEIEKPLTVNQFIMEFTPELMEKLTKLRRWLKENGRIPKETDEKKFLQIFTEHSIKSYIENNYSFLKD